MITVDEYPLGQTIRYDIKSTSKTELTDFMIHIFNRYPAWAYNTIVEYSEYHEGTYVSRISRSQSCD